MDTKSEKSFISKAFYTNLAGSIPVSRRIFKSPYFQRYSSKTLKVRFFLCFLCSEISGKNRLSVTTKRLCRGLCDTECVTKSPLICEPIRRQKT